MRGRWTPRSLYAVSDRDVQKTQKHVASELVFGKSPDSIFSEIVDVVIQHGLSNACAFLFPWLNDDAGRGICLGHVLEEVWR
jgi:hypothetical protein